MAERITVGAIAGAYGVRGEVRVKSFCATPEAIVDYLPLVTDTGQVIDRLEITGRTSGALTARLPGVEDKEAADALRGRQLLADRARLPALPDDEFYHADLIGLEVFDTGGARLGTVRGVANHGAGDLLEVHVAGGKSLLLPFTREIVPTVDLTARRIVADPPGEL